MYFFLNFMKLENKCISFKFIYLSIDFKLNLVIYNGNFANCHCSL